MKKIALFAAVAGIMLSLSACMGTRGTVGGQRVCENDYLFGVLSISELFSPCGGNR